MPKAPPGHDTGDDRAPTALEDTGTGQAFILLGWIPPAVAALVGGVIAAIATGDPLAVVVVFLGGTVVGYIAGLVVLFTVGWFLEGRVGERVANLFLLLVIAVSVAAALAVAVAASGFELDDSVERTLSSVGGLVVIVFLVASLVAMRRPRN